MATLSETNAGTGSTETGGYSDSIRTLAGADAGQVTVTPDADREDLIRELPETEVENHTLSATGEWWDVRRELAQTRVAEPRVETKGFRIPTGNFRSVTVTVENSEGEPLKSARWVQSAGLFPTAARVREAPDGSMVARLWLLNAAYDEFTVIGESDREDVDFVWYQSDGSEEPAIGSSSREATLRFSVVEPGGNNNLSVGFGASIGGT